MKNHAKKKSLEMLMIERVILLMLVTSRTAALSTEPSIDVTMGLREDRGTEESINNVDVNEFDHGGIDKILPEGGDDILPSTFDLPQPSSVPPTPQSTQGRPPPTYLPPQWSTIRPQPDYTRYPDSQASASASVATTVLSTTSEERTETSYYVPERRTESPDITLSTIFSASCDFGSFPNATLCEWKNGKNATLLWQAGSGNGANWLGGPLKDVNTNTQDGGYAFVETSQTPPIKKFRKPGASLESPVLGNTGPRGTCLSFSFAIMGLSPSGFYITLEDIGIDENLIRKAQRPKDEESQRLWEAQYHSEGAWQEANLLYNYHTPHKLVMVAEPADSDHPSRKYRGFIATDVITLRPGSYCQGFCSFTAGFCDWANEAGDEFDWSLSRGSSNPVTGPTMDSSRQMMNAGSYAYIDSEFPRRPGDVARLVSSTFPPTGNDAPLCMRFWFHMFGPAVGTLRVLLRRLRHDAFFPLQLWSVTGSAGNAWFMAQVTIASLQEYQIILEASVGNTAMSDIAVDDVTFSQGPCPVAPQVAAPKSGDCNFEVDECGWVDGGSKNSVNWERIPTRSQKQRNKRPPLSDSHAANSHNEYFLGLGSRTSPHMGATARLTSRVFQGSSQPSCITFWYLMSEPFIDMSGSSLGVLQVFLKTQKDALRPMFTPIWQLYNNQGITWRYAQIPLKETNNYSIVFEGSWGPNRASGAIAIDDIAFYTGECRITPLEAHVQLEDCSFERGLCGWHNWTRVRGEGKVGDRIVAWQKAVDSHRPSQLLDRTFGTSGGFLFFDIFNTNQKESAVMLVSSSIKMRENEEAICFTFWYSAFGAGESTHLLVLRTRILDDPDNAARETLWELTPEGIDTSRPVWSPGQVTVDAKTPFKLVLEGKASNGGFAVDDVRIMPGKCKIRPPEAMPVKETVVQ